MVKSIKNFIKNQLIVSCQAVDNEPLNNTRMLTMMAKSCVIGGAKILRLSQLANIKAIKKELPKIPVIGLVKQKNINCEVFITPKLQDCLDLIALNVEIIAMDATLRKRPAENLNEIIYYLKTHFPKQLLMADCSTIEDMQNAEKLGFDFIGTTLVGLTKESAGLSNVNDDYAFIKKCLTEIKTPIIAEGGIWSPEQAKAIKNLGVYAVVVGSAITRPHLIVEHYLKKFND